MAEQKQFLQVLDRDEAERRVAQARDQLEDALKGKRPTEIASLEAQLAQARAAVTFSETEFIRMEKLVKSKISQPQELEQALSTRDQDRQRVAQLESDRSRLKEIARKGRLYVETNYDFSATMVSAMRWVAGQSFAPDREEPASRVLDSPAPQNEIQRWADFRSYAKLVEGGGGSTGGVVGQIARSAKNALSKLGRRPLD